MKFSKKVYFIAAFILLIVILVPVARNSVIDYCTQNGTSMTPTIKNGENFWLNKLAYKASLPKQWDIVAFNSPTKNNKIYIMRIVGLPGDKIESKNNELYINGKKLKYPENLKYLHYTSNFIIPSDAVFTLPKIEYPYTVPPNSYYVRGDNNIAAYDSRGWGAIAFKNIIGKVIL